MVNTLDKYLNLPDLEKYNCVLWGYTASLSQLYVRLFATQTDYKKHLYLGFNSVAYFSGPTKWVGANFRFGTRDEIISLIQSGIIEFPEDAIASYLNAHRLFISEKPNFAISILASANVLAITDRINSHISSEPSD